MLYMNYELGFYQSGKVYDWNIFQPFFDEKLNYNSGQSLIHGFTEIEYQKAISLYKKN